MQINNEQKQKLRKILDDISTPEERADLAKQDKLENIQNSVKDVGSFGKALEGIKDFFNQRIDRVESKVKNIKPTDLTPLLEVLTETKDILSKPQKQQDMSGFFKDLGTQLVQFGTSTKNTEEIIRNLKWNSTMGIKDRNGSPVNPAEAGLKLGTYDYVALVQATLTDTYTFKVGGASGQLVATVIITFTDATKSTISNVVKTPII